MKSLARRRCSETALAATAKLCAYVQLLNCAYCEGKLQQTRNAWVNGICLTCTTWAMPSVCFSLKAMIIHTIRLSREDGLV